MFHECWEAGHAGDYDANHVFGQTVEKEYVSVSNKWEYSGSVIRCLYFISLMIMTSTV